MTGSGNNGFPQSVEPAIDANSVFVFAGDIRRPGDEMYGKVNRVENHP